MDKKIICFGCGALVPDTKGPTHPYMLSTPGCWMLYQQALGRLYGFGYKPDILQRMVDAYAVSHPGRNERRAVQSVNGHLISLYFSCEKSQHDSHAARIKQVIENKQLVGSFTWLEPPDLHNTLHITDIMQKINEEAFIQAVINWSESVWNVWKQKYLHIILSYATKLQE